MDKPRFLCVGAAHWDLIARSDRMLGVGGDVPGRIQQRPGGVALNVALGLAGRGMRTSLCAIVGSDDAGTSLIRLAEAADLDCMHVLGITGAATDRYMAIEQGDGDLFAAVADVGLLEAHAPAIVAQTARAVPEADTLVLDANLPKAAIEDIAKQAASSGAEIIANPVSPAKARRLGVLLSDTYAPTIIANLAEANALLQSSLTSSPDAAAALLTRGAGTVLVTDGARPAALATRDSVVIASPPAVDGAVSVTGAGDALLAGYLAFPGRQRDAEAALAAALRAAVEHMRLS